MCCKACTIHATIMEIKKLENGTYELSGVEVNENGVVILTKDVGHSDEG